VGLAVQAAMIFGYLFARDLGSFVALALVFGTAYGGVMPLIYDRLGSYAWRFLASFAIGPPNPPSLVAPRRSRGAPRFLARRGRVAFDEVPLGVVSLRHFSVTFPGGLALARPRKPARRLRQLKESRRILEWT
jgi:hypothetical protein